MDVIKAIEDFDYYHGVTGLSRETWEHWRIKAVKEWQLKVSLLNREEKNVN